MSRLTGMKPLPTTTRPRFGDDDGGATRASLAAGGVLLFAAFAVIGYLLCRQLGVLGWRPVPLIAGLAAGA